MANPQPDKYTRISNELMEYVPRFRFNGTQLSLILIIWRYTYGFRRKEHEFSLSFLTNAIGAARSQVDREVTALIKRNVLEVLSGGSGKTRVIRFNKDFDTWVKPEERPPQKRSVPAAPPVPPPPPPKKPRSKLKPEQYSHDNTYYKMAAYFHEKIVAMAADIGFNHSSIAKADLQKWADDFRRLVELDKVTDKQLIRDVINWVTNDPFWRVNCLSPRKLRDKFAEFALKMKSQKAAPAMRPRNERPSIGSMSDVEQMKKLQEWIDSGGDPSEFPDH